MGKKKLYLHVLLQTFTADTTDTVRIEAFDSFQVTSVDYIENGNLLKGLFRVFTNRDSFP